VSYQRKPEWDIEVNNRRGCLLLWLVWAFTFVVGFLTGVVFVGCGQ
jgi:hypothetical protein